MNPTADAVNFLEIDDVVKDFDGQRAVDHVSLRIARGEIFALLGSSGCGKTTLLRLLAGFETPSAGRIVLNGHDLSGLPPYERPLNMMFQSYALFPHLSVWDNIAFGLRRDRLPRHTVAERVEAMLKLVQLDAYARRKPHQLSGGQQQRVALARSLAKQPQLLLLDEPLGALDKKLREETQRELARIIAQVGVTCVMVTHDQEEAMTMASRIGVMSQGRLLQVGTPGEIYETPATRFVADFIGHVNLWDGTVEMDAADHTVVACDDCRHRLDYGIDLARGAAVTVALRPEKIHLTRERRAGDEKLNTVGGIVREVGYLGGSTLLRLELPSGRRLIASHANVDRPRGDAWRAGDLAWAHWPATAPVIVAP